MRNSIVLMTLFAGFLTACQTKSPEEKADSLAAAPDTTMADAKTCYAYIKNKDTISLTLNTVSHDVTGELNYNLYEKDKNTGTITGIIKGDTIIADYTFLSEGKNSVRQVVFLKKDNQLSEGYGSSKEENGKMTFTNKSALKFDGNIILTEIPCK